MKLCSSHVWFPEGKGKLKSETLTIGKMNGFLLVFPLTNQPWVATITQLRRFKRRFVPLVVACRKVVLDGKTFAPFGMVPHAVEPEKVTVETFVVSSSGFYHFLGQNMVEGEAQNSSKVQICWIRWGGGGWGPGGGGWWWWWAVAWNGVPQCLKSVLVCVCLKRGNPPPKLMTMLNRKIMTINHGRLEYQFSDKPI